MLIYICRRLIWERNVQLVEKHNLEADRGVHTYTMGINEYSDMVGNIVDLCHLINVLKPKLEQNETKLEGLYPYPFILVVFICRTGYRKYPWHLNKPQYHQNGV